MPVSALALGFVLVGPPALPPEGGGGLPDVESPDAPAPEEPPVETPPAADAPEEAPAETPPAAEDAPVEVAPEEPPAADAPEDEAIPVDSGEDDDDDDRADEGAAAGGAAAGGASGGAGGSGGASSGGAPAPAVQQPVQAPSATPQQPSGPSSASGPQRPSAGSPSGPSSGAPSEGPTEPPAQEPELDAGEQEQAEPDDERKKNLGGFRLFRIGIAPKIGYTHGTSDKEGLFDREKSIQDSIDNMELTTSGAGDLGQTQFGGFQYGFILDAEIVGINVWVDFHKFFRPGGMWSLLLGYDHEFGFGERLRLDVGVAGGLNQVFLGDVLEGLYYDENDPTAVNIGTLGVEGRAMVDLHIKLVGPLYTGPYALLGYHYLWSANVDEVTAEKGLHYSAGWSLRLDFAAPKLLGRRK